MFVQNGGAFDAALPKLIQLIDDGYNEAYFLVGCIYELGGRGIQQNYKNAFFYFQKSAETLGLVEAYLGLARCYYFGHGLEVDYGKAFKYYLHVEQQTPNPIAWLMLGQMYRKGQGVARDFDKARQYLTKAADKGYVVALAQLGVLEQELGHTIRGWLLRIKAALMGMKIASTDAEDPRLRDS